jgi:hypothetical protein
MTPWPRVIEDLPLNPDVGRWDSKKKYDACLHIITKLHNSSHRSQNVFEECISRSLPAGLVIGSLAIPPGPTKYGEQMPYKHGIRLLRRDQFIALRFVNSKPKRDSRGDGKMRDVSRRYE